MKKKKMTNLRELRTRRLIDYEDARAVISATIREIELQMCCDEVSIDTEYTWADIREFAQEREQGVD